MTTTGKRSVGQGIWQGRCPRCREGDIFASRFRMHEKCLFCGLGFEREQGYFVGAMYISYGVAIPFYLGFYFLLRHYLHQSVLITVAFATLMFLPFVPLVFRASRILWIYFDRAVDPESHL